MKNKILNLKNFIVNFPRKTLIKNILIFVLVFTITAGIDWISKRHIFPSETFQTAGPQTHDIWFKQGYYYDWKIIGLRPLLHIGVTSKLNELIGFTAIHIFSVSIIIILLPIIIFNSKNTYAILLSILIGGNFGNMIDRFMYDNGVRDILFIPFRDNGTFNIADIFIFIGSIGSCLAILYFQFLHKFLKAKFTAKANEKSLNKDLSSREEIDKNTEKNQEKSEE